MLKTSFALAAAVLGTAILGSQTAQGSTIDTFNLVETGWDAYSIITGVGPANPNGLLTASFSGSVEADGFIALADLSAFVLSSNITGEPQTINLAGISLFSYNVNGGTGSFDFAGTSTRGNEVCLGAAVGLDGACNLQFQAGYPGGTRAIAEFGGGPAGISFNAPEITLVSSTVPEPGSLSLIGVALTLLGGWLLYSRKILSIVARKPAALFLEAVEILSVQNDR